MALNWNYLTATTREVFVKKLVDNIYSASAGLKIMLMDHSTKLAGGRKVVEPILYSKNTSRGRYSGFDTFNMEPPDNLTASEYTWGNYYATIAISGDDEDMNMGEAQVLSLIAQRTQEAETTLKDLIADDFYSGTNTKGIIGLDSAVGTGTYGGIAVADFAGWVSGVDAGSHTEANMLDSTNASYIHKLLRKAWRSCLNLGETPNLILTTPLVWDIYEQSLQANARYPKSVNKRQEMIADAGFMALDWRGVPVVADEKCPAGYMFILNTKYLTLRIHPNKNFTFTGFQKPINQDARAGQVLFKSQLCVNNRRMHYKFSGLPTS